MTMMCNNAFADCGTSASNLCYDTFTRKKDGMMYKQGWYYTNGSYGTKTSVNKYIIAGCADGYYMPSNDAYMMETAVYNKCHGNTILTSLDQVAIEECCWSCPFYDGEESTQECYYIHFSYNTEMPVSKCYNDWCRSSRSNKDPYSGITTCLVTPEYPEGATGFDKTGDWQMASSCGFGGGTVDNKCKCYPRSDYNQQCG